MLASGLPALTRGCLLASMGEATRRSGGEVSAWTDSRDASGHLRRAGADSTGQFGQANKLCSSLAT